MRLLFSGSRAGCFAAGAGPRPVARASRQTGPTTIRSVRDPDGKKVKERAGRREREKEKEKGRTKERTDKRKQKKARDSRSHSPFGRIRELKGSIKRFKKPRELKSHEREGITGARERNHPALPGLSRPRDSRKKSRPFYRALSGFIRARPKAAAGIRGRNFKGARGSAAAAKSLALSLFLTLERTVSAPSEILCANLRPVRAPKSRWRGIKSY